MKFFSDAGYGGKQCDQCASNVAFECHYEKGGLFCIILHLSGSNCEFFEGMQHLMPLLLSERRVAVL